ncbi:MAG: hypothetical protein COV91_04605 [Candidatus Taylorbacteria bacterium CG11_big_fil_rev_8_21_14_0_20_46_11]|uniref:Uncharacterized protein n=1 Tax=Candidatus Taylorbacteria bacterium CG11_big_fil_rev_8_21_14_0_20_46_11 TaxID=1975025 RepID=A0A2H0KCQ1_9BACT|nr:MAG: hypothetical protein COV91_04605 [Candidatus Taylorbacteria bacterium CG11_big_fil_rev_8_21_14_0_20_46_11]
MPCAKHKSTEATRKSAEYGGTRKQHGTVPSRSAFFISCQFSVLALRARKVVTGFLMGNKGVRWMPRLEMAMKDVAWRRYASGRCRATFDPKISEWGNLSA